MKPRGLIPDEWLLSYASGALSEAHALIVASHASYHPELQEKIDGAHAIGGALLDNQSASTLADDAFDVLMDKIDQSPLPTAQDSQSLSASKSSDIPQPLADYLQQPLSSLQWRMMGPGLRQKRLWDGPNGEKLWLLKAKGGTEIPHHDHNGLEMTLVLTGSYHVGNMHYTPGLIELADADLKDHRPVIDKGEDCICLVVTEAPIKLHSFIGRLVQPFIGL